MNQSNERWEFPFRDCIVAADSFPALQVQEAIENERGMICVIFDLRRFAGEIEKLGLEQVIARYLSSQEQEYWKRLTSAKRKREWLGGRFAAKYVAAELLTRRGNGAEWSTLTVLYDKKGRPVLAANDKRMDLPDISISHSGDLAASMAINTGLCGIDIQKITDRVARVRDRFCTPQEEEILLSFFNSPDEQNITVLSKLWAAKEALRKVEKSSVLPGFLEFELKKIKEASLGKNPFWEFIFTRKQSNMSGTAGTRKHNVKLSLITDYVLAVTTSGDIVT